MIRIQLAEPDVDRLEQAFRQASIVSSATASRSVAVPLAVEDEGNEEAERSGEHVSSRSVCAAVGAPCQPNLVVGNDARWSNGRMDNGRS
jgi:hypothetical protein